MLDWRIDPYKSATAAGHYLKPFRMKCWSVPFEFIELLMLLIFFGALLVWRSSHLMLELGNHGVFWRLAAQIGRIAIRYHRLYLAKTPKK
jgi:hypothetical protein